MNTSASMKSSTDSATSTVVDAKEAAKPKPAEVEYDDAEDWAIAADADEDML